MFAEILLGFGGLAVVLAGGSLAYHNRVAAGRLEEERKQQKSALRETLIRRLKKFRLSDFNLGEVLAEATLSETDKAGVIEDVYSAFVKHVISDGIITEKESKFLAAIRDALRVSSTQAALIEESAKTSKYQEVMNRIVGDESITPEEAAELESLRKGLNITEEVSRIAAIESTGFAYENMIRRIIDKGRLTPEDLELLAHFKQTLGVFEGKSLLTDMDSRLRLFRECFSSILSDGEVTPDEERLLKWLQDEAGVGREVAAGYWSKIDRAKELSRVRKGQLPSLKSRSLLDSGELCHWEGESVHIYQTSKSIKSVSGNLVVTNKRVLFVSPVKSFHFAPWKVANIERLNHRDLYLQLQVTRGTGTYRVGDMDLLEAVMVGLVKRGKGLLVERFSSELTRHIPEHVKREVWARDGGKCVLCSDANYLEFDHVIPHSRGGANTTGNVRLLCRRCNLQKGDKI